MSDLVGNPEDRFSHDEAQLTKIYRTVGMTGMPVPKSLKFIAGVLEKKIVQQVL